MTGRILAIAVAATVTTALVGGCGSDDEGSSSNDVDGGPDASAAGGTSSGGAAAAGSGGTAASTSGGTGGTTAGGASPAGGTTGTPDARSPEQTGDACVTPADCYPNIDPASLSGPVQCLDRVDDGYCTHECDTDADCCAAAGECRTGLRQVCAPFESTGLRLCFLSCEQADLRAANDAGTLIDSGVANVDANEYCQREAHPSFSCRSTGGGRNNRRVCVPGGVATDAGPPPEAGPASDAASDAAEGGSTDASLPSDAAADGNADANDGSADATAG